MSPSKNGAQLPQQQPTTLSPIMFLTSISTTSRCIVDTRILTNMALSEDIIDFDLIDLNKENITTLPGGRSAKALVQQFSSGTHVSLEETKTLNDAIRNEYEIELQTINEADDPLDCYSYVSLQTFEPADSFADAT